MPRSLVWSLAAAVALGCAGRLPPCASDVECDARQECLANRCRALGSDPVGAATLRTVVEPRAMAVVGGVATDSPTTLPGTVTLGADHGPRVVWLLAFELPPLGELDTALLVLEPAAGAVQPSADLGLHAWRAEATWSPGALPPLTRVPLGPPRADGIARALPIASVRLDVTPLVRYWLANPRANFGLAIEGADATPTGIVLETGVGGGVRPRLELYATRYRTAT